VSRCARSWVGAEHRNEPSLSCMNGMDHDSRLSSWPFIAEAQKRGAKVVVIDPVLHRTARTAKAEVQQLPLLASELLFSHAVGARQPGQHGEYGNRSRGASSGQDNPPGRRKQRREQEPEAKGGAHQADGADRQEAT
jgi:hypothetical protein